MSTLRRTLATAAASVLAVTALAPAASAQLNLGVIDLAIDNIKCEDLDNILTTAKLKNDTTTRSELVKNLSNYAGDLDLGIKFIVADYAGKIADRSLECGDVNPDAPELFPGSSQISDIFLTLSSN